MFLTYFYKTRAWTVSQYILILLQSNQKVRVHDKVRDKGYLPFATALLRFKVQTFPKYILKIKFYHFNLIHETFWSQVN